ncbi:MAG: acyl-CoA dehydrogenase [Acidimicrobiales bacterium]
MPFAEEYGGGGFPWLKVGIVMQELLNSANMALAMAPLLTQGNDRRHPPPRVGGTGGRSLLLKMVSAEWTGSMNLTEPDAGSDVGALRTKAVKQDDGSYRISGQKIFITFGEHSFTDNIVHLVLARTPARLGTKGISLFIVPKYLVNDDGSLGERNDVHIVSVEHKMGIKASPTCVLAYGDRSEGAIGYLVGEENAGMRYMFTMMNNARLGVGVEGLGLAERSYQKALQYAKERKQGFAPGAARGEKSFIIEHPDVRRMLLTMKAYTESMRLMCFKVAEQIDVLRYGADEPTRTAAQEMVDLLIPLTKSYCTDLAETVTSIGIQVHGGMGFIEETGAAQYYRDTKITQIYEGTNGIQAMDLVGRKLPMRAGGVYQDQVGRMKATVEELAGAGEDLAVVHRELAAAVAALEDATGWILSEGLADPVQALSAASPYQRLFATTVAGWLMALQGLAAKRVIDAGGSDAELAEVKLVTSRFFAEHLLPAVHGLVAPVKAGKDDLFALTAEQL